MRKERDGEWHATKVCCKNQITNVAIKYEKVTCTTTNFWMDKDYVMS